MYQNLKNNITELILSKNIINEKKNILFNILINVLKGEYTVSNTIKEKLLERICFCISILALCGLQFAWQSCIEDLIKFGLQSEENIYISVIILGNLNIELNAMDYGKKYTMMMRDNLIEKKDIVKNFIINILTNNNQIHNTLLCKVVISKSIELSKNWIQFKINFLEITSFIQVLTNIITYDNIIYISEFLCEAFAHAVSEKNMIYRVIEVSNINNNCLSKFKELINSKEIESITIILNKLESLSKSYNPSNDPNDIIITEIANIVAGITENFVYLFFYKDSISIKLYQFLKELILYKKRKISYKLFQTISDIREFINDYYKLENYNDNDKKEFIKFLMEIVENTMLNCKLKTIDIKYDLILKKDILCIDIADNTSNINNEDNPDDINISDYRQSAEDIFYNIFIILVNNFKEEGANIFFNAMNNILINSNIKDISILTDNNRLLNIEVVLYVMQPIIESFETLGMSAQPIINFINQIFDSCLLSNQKMIINFLIFLDKACPYIYNDKNAFIRTISFLFSLCKEQLLQKLIFCIIYDITSFMNKPNLEYFNIIYDSYIQYYDTIKDVESLEKIVMSLIECLMINNKNIINDTELEKYINIILSPSSNRILKLLDYTNTTDSTVLYEIYKNYSIQNTILKELINRNEVVYHKVFVNHMNTIFKVSETIIYNIKDSTVLNKIYDLYINITSKLIPSNINYYISICSLFSKIYNGSISENKIVYILNNLLSFFSSNNIEVQTLFFNICKLMSYQIVNTQYTSNDTIKAFADIFFKVYPKIYNIPNEYNIIISDSIKVYIESLKAVNENAVIYIIIKAFSVFVSDSNNIVDTLLEDIIYTIFNQIDKFDSISISAVNTLLCNSISYRKSQCLDILKKVFKSENYIKTFSNEYINLIIEYFEIFGEDENKIKKLVNVILEIKQEKTFIETLNFFGMQIASKKLNRKEK